jgi:glutamate-1-semialdehyde 2,1-aminomutase
VLVNPVQSFHPNTPPPSDAVLVSSGVRRVREADQEYARWLADLRSVCTAAGVPLILDEVYTGFRLAPRGAQDYFGVQADIVVYGKTVAGGLPIGVVCGRRELMRRFDPEHPMRLAYVVGTFSAHPLVMGAMHEFLTWATGPKADRCYEALNQRVGEWVDTTNRRLETQALPVRVANLGSIWTVIFTAPGRFNWLLQYYLRARGVMLSWVGTGRCLCSMDFREEHYAELREALVGAAQQMKDDAWWPDPATQALGERQMQRYLLKDAVKSLVPMPVRRFHAEVMLRKDEDHHASHNDLGNQLLHLVSSSVFLYCYAILFVDLTQAMCLGLAALFLRQFGHAVLEPDAHEKELTLLGYTTRDKSLIVGGYALIPLWHVLPDVSWAVFVHKLPAIAEHWWLWTQFVIALRVAYLIWKFDVRTSLIWYVKLVTDPLTDVIAYFPRRHRAVGA